MATCDQLKAQVEALITTSQGYVDKAKALAEQGKAATTVDQSQGIVSQLATLRQDNAALWRRRLEELTNQGSSQGCAWASLSSGYVEQVRSQIKSNDSALTDSYTAADMVLARLQRELRQQAAKPAPTVVTPPDPPPPTPDAQPVTPQETTQKTENQSSDDKAETLDPVQQETLDTPDSTTTAPPVPDIPNQEKKKSDTSTPGRRPYNPLAKYPTYTYNLTLYMVSPQAYDEFILSGRLKLNVAPGGGAVLIAQSGGINNSVETRGAGFGLDYYIDNLKITTATSGKDNGTSTNTTELEFAITEPYGFSFISNLKKASDKIIEEAKTAGLEKLGNAARQFFILGIRFTGFNEDGTPASSQDDPLYERFYDIALTGMKFKLDAAKNTVYNISASSMAPGTAFGTKRGVWSTGGKLKGSTVYAMLNNMMETMNKESADSLKKAKSQTKPNNYRVLFQGEGVGDDQASQKAAPIFKASMKSESDIGKSKLIGNTPDKTGQKPIAADQGKPDTNATEITIPSGTPVLQAFELIISRSAYIEDAFKVLQTSALESDPQKTQGTTELTTDNQGTVRWYNVSAECTGARFSPELGDFCWDITYIFTTYETPVVVNPYSNLGIKYYGPHKRYDYWYTGKNTEVLSYSQNLDNTFFNVAVNATDQNSNTAPSQNNPPTAAGQPQNQPPTGTQNTQSAGKKAYVNSLFDPGAYANASVKILGDPDFLVPESTTSVQSVYSQFYGPDGYTINCNGGQVFVEIDFKEPIDYGFTSSDNTSYFSTSDGLLNLNKSIQFWNYPEEIDNIVDGVSYQVITVKSSFSQGKFEQDLQLVINQFPGYKTPEERAKGSAQGSAGSGSAAAPAGTGTDTRSGANSGGAPSDLKKDPQPTPSGTPAQGTTPPAPPKPKET